MKRTSAKVGDTVRVHLSVASKFRKGRIFHDGVVCEISYKKNRNPWQKLFKNGYVMLSGNFILHLNGRFVRSTRRKIALDRIVRITRKVNRVLETA